MFGAVHSRLCGAGKRVRKKIFSSKCWRKDMEWVLIHVHSRRRCSLSEAASGRQRRSVWRTRALTLKACCSSWPLQREASQTHRADYSGFLTQSRSIFAGYYELRMHCDHRQTGRIDLAFGLIITLKVVFQECFVSCAELSRCLFVFLSQRLTVKCCQERL